MRVGLLIYGSLDTLSGGYLYDRVMVDHLREQGDTVEIISLPWRTYGSHLLDNLDQGLFRRLASLSVDVLVQDELNHPSLFALNDRLRRIVKYPIISIVHHLRCMEPRVAWQNTLYRMPEKRYLASVDGFIFNSVTSKKIAEGLVGDQRPSAVVYPAGDRLGLTLDEAQISARAYEAGPLRVFFLGNIIPRKGLHLLIDALVPLSNWELVAAGSLTADPAYVHQIRHRIQRLGLQDFISLVGPLSGEALIHQLSTSHVLAMPSFEGFGIAYLEGMACGLPAIGLTTGGAHEIITHGENGFLINPNNTLALIHHLQQLSDARDVLERMSLAARRRYDQHPTWAQSAAGFRMFLQSLI